MHSGSNLRIIFIISLLIFSPISILLALAIGPANISIYDIFQILIGGGSGVDRVIVLDIRLPRILVSFMAGSSLAVAGAMAQAVFKNPLGDPYLLGISSGASLGAVVGMILNPHYIPIFAFLFAIAITFLVYSIGLSAGGKPTSLILSGIAVGMLINSIVWYLILFLPELHGIYAWFLGSFSTTMWIHFYILLPVFFIAILSPLFYKWLNLLMLRDEEAMSLGLNVRSSRTIIIILISLLTATVVSIAGLIGFVGLVVPHICRLVVGANHKYLMPSSLLFGGIFLLLSDTLARAGSTEIPVGIITAMMGSPLFIYLLVRVHVKG